MRLVGLSALLALQFATACGGNGTAPIHAARTAGQRVDEAFGPLEVGADYASFRKVSSEPFLSSAHGGRWVEVYVNAIGADAYVRGTAVPDGTIVVKTSWQDDHGHASAVPGPIFVMRKDHDGSAPERGDWYYAIHWAKPTADQGGPIYWRGDSPKVEYCYLSCHTLYDRGLGGLTPSSLVPR